MSDLSSFVEGINAAPDDDQPRLVFADWLEERGDSNRAEFVRLQIQRAALPFWDARQIPLLARENELLGLHGEIWRQELPAIDGVVWGAFRRGFVATASIADFRVFKKVAHACWAATPLEAVNFGDWPDDALDSFDPIEGLRELSITQTVFHERPLRQLADAPLLSSLDTLRLDDCALGAEGLREILFSPYLKRLKTLRIPYNSIGGVGVDVLVGTESLPSLVELDLTEQDSYARYEEDPVVKAGDLELLVHWRQMKNLESLSLSGNEVGEQGLRILCQDASTANLKRLAIRGNGLPANAIAELANAANGMQLEVLDVGQNMFGDQGASHLARATCLSQLKVLNVDRCEILPPGIGELCQAPFVHELRRWNLRENRLGVAGVESLLKAEPENLHTLEIGFNDIGVEGAVELAQSPVSKQIQALDLSFNGLDDDAMKALIESSNFTSLRLLHLSRNSFTGPAMASLTRSPLFKQLVKFDQVEHDDHAIPFHPSD